MLTKFFFIVWCFILSLFSVFFCVLVERNVVLVVLFTESSCLLDGRRFLKCVSVSGGGVSDFYFYFLTVSVSLCSDQACLKYIQYVYKCCCYCCCCFYLFFSTIADNQTYYKHHFASLLHL